MLVCVIKLMTGGSICSAGPSFQSLSACACLLGWKRGGYNNRGLQAVQRGGGEPGPTLSPKPSALEPILFVLSPRLLFPRRLASTALAPPPSLPGARGAAAGAPLCSPSRRVGRRSSAPRAACHDSGSGAYLRRQSRSSSEDSRGTHPGRSPTPTAARNPVREGDARHRARISSWCLRRSRPAEEKWWWVEEDALSSVSGRPWLTPELLAGLEIVRRRRPRHPSNPKVLDPSAAAAPPPNLLALDPAGRDPSGI